MPPEIPQNGGYAIAAYVVAGAIYLLYTASLMMRGRKELGKGD